MRRWEGEEVGGCGEAEAAGAAGDEDGYHCYGGEWVGFCVVGLASLEVGWRRRIGGIMGGGVWYLFLREFWRVKGVCVRGSNRVLRGRRDERVEKEGGRGNEYVLSSIYFFGEQQLAWS